MQVIMQWKSRNSGSGGNNASGKARMLLVSQTMKVLTQCHPGTRGRKGHTLAEVGFVYLSHPHSAFGAAQHTHSDVRQQQIITHRAYLASLVERILFKGVGH